MDNTPELVVMLTYNDKTAADAPQIFESCRSCKAGYVGFKEEDLPLPEMKKLFAEIKKCGKTAVLEVVAYDEESCLRGAQMAVDCGCDILMGTMFYDSVNALCKQHGLKYMPYVGEVYDRPSVLDGTVDGMIEEANSLIERGADGFDLLAYRYTGDAHELIRRFVAEVDAPVCLAGSVDSYDKLDEILAASPWAFTIGSAFFDNCFEGSFCEQIDKVCGHLEKAAVTV